LNQIGVDVACQSSSTTTRRTRRCIVPVQ
jgi:hypothetical protein